jgi:hypothetical protein
VGTESVCQTLWWAHRSVKRGSPCPWSFQALLEPSDRKQVKKYSRSRNCTWKQVVRQALCPQQGLLEAWPWVLISSHTDLPLQGISSVPSVFSLGDSHSPATHLDHAHDSPSPPPPSWLISRFPSQQWSLPPFCCTRQSLTPPCTPFLSRGHQFYLWASLQSATSLNPP